MTQEVLIYDIQIKPVVSQWRITYHYDGEIGSILRPSLKQAIKWCEDRGYPYCLLNKDGSEFNKRKVK